jgi:hypothetical protein
MNGSINGRPRGSTKIVEAGVPPADLQERPTRPPLHRLAERAHLMIYCRAAILAAVYESAAKIAALPLRDLIIGSE